MSKRDPEREHRLRRVVGEWERSGQTALEFCRDRGLNVHTLYGWRRELRRPSGERGGKSKRGGVGRRPRRFVQLEVSTATWLELGVGGDLVLRVPSCVSGDRLAEILVAARKATSC